MHCQYFYFDSAITTTVLLEYIIVQIKKFLAIIHNLLHLWFQLHSLTAEVDRQTVFHCTENQKAYNVYKVLLALHLLECHKNYKTYAIVLTKIGDILMNKLIVYYLKKPGTHKLTTGIIIIQ